MKEQLEYFKKLKQKTHKQEVIFNQSYLLKLRKINMIIRNIEDLIEVSQKHTKLIKHNNRIDNFYNKLIEDLLVKEGKVRHTTIQELYKKEYNEKIKRGFIRDMRNRFDLNTRIGKYKDETGYMKSERYVEFRSEKRT
jgi:hypothetical protein